MVQGAGGNVSWKDGEVLWIKASGAWLADAETRDIFVPVDLPSLRHAISAGDFNARPQVVGVSNLRPSIETMFHALLPHRIVAHLHAIEILAHLVRVEPLAELARRIGTDVSWALVEYFKPGAELAQAVHRCISAHAELDVVLLRNHGVIIGTPDVATLDALLDALGTRLKITVASADPVAVTAAAVVHPALRADYAVCQDQVINQLASHPEYLPRLEHDWALCPDHVVFLGHRAAVVNAADDPQAFERILSDQPPFVFVRGQAVYQRSSATAAQHAQLRCYHDLLARQRPDQALTSLHDGQIAELLNWDAEKYRQALARVADGT
jgi:rhamnose utilization protein RhaD (predicted bifunctional aldolase and dehydrogenase)